MNKRNRLRAFDPQASHQLGAVIVLLNARPPLFVRWALRWYKRRLGQAV